jgi:4-hydroxybenzoate polyprenyltransferase
MVADADAHLGELVLSPILGAALGCVAGALLWLVSGTGSVLTLAVSGVLGWLFALCQQRTNWLGYLLVGLSYGVTVWIGSRIVGHTAVLSSSPLRPDLGHCILFTELLALGALAAATMRSQNSLRTLPKD